MTVVLRQIGCFVGATLALAGCATTGVAGQGFDGKAKQADERLPAAQRFYDDAERKLVEEAQGRQEAGRKAREEGNLEKARAEFAAAAERYAKFADAFPSSEWRIAFRYRAAEFHLFAQQHERAAEQADKVLAEPDASATSRAMAAQLAAAGWLGVARHRIEAGQLEAVKLRAAGQRAGAPLAPRELPDPWKRFVAAVDAFVRVWEKHPTFAKRGGEPNLALTPWSAELLAAQVEFSWDRMDDARRRLQTIVDTWPAELGVMKSAVPDLLEAILALGDAPGFSTAADRLKAVATEQAERAQDPKAKDAWNQVRDDVVRLKQSVDFAEAKRLYDAGSWAQAVEAFERFVSQNASATDAPAALWNAGLAWERLEKPDKASEAREAIVAKYPESGKAALATLYLANAASKRGDHEGAARRYATYLERWSDAPDRCVALQNVGFELDLQGKKEDAAQRFVAFGTDERCAGERPNEATKALCRAGKLLIEAKSAKMARGAFEAATRIGGVTDPTALRMVEDAKQQAKRLPR